MTQANQIRRRTTVVVLAGLPGSGKSYHADELRHGPVDQPRNTVIVSADHFFTDAQGVYRFNPAGLGEAHATCFRRFLRFLKNHENDGIGNDTLASVIVVDNTNTSAIELAPYIAAARAFDADLVIRFFTCSVETAARRTIHKVPASSIAGMASRMLDMLAAWPPFWPTPEVFDTEHSFPVWAPGHHLVRPSISAG